MLKYLMDFIKEKPNTWIEKIQQEPYNIKVREKDKFILLMYDQLSSNMSLPICQVCRGIILEKQEELNTWTVVCYPFNKFFNYGEDEAAEINWRTAKVREKIDGSLIKFWTDTSGKWHVSTNKTIDAFDAQVSDNLEGLSYGDIIERALGCDYNSFCEELIPCVNYMFELVSPDTQVTIRYEQDKLYYLGQRDQFFHQESYAYNPVWKEFGIEQPKVYDINSLEDCISLVNEFTKDEEGVVVSDRNFNRIKVKSPEYLIAAHAANNGKLSLRTAVRLIREDKVDDFLAYAPMHRVKMDLITAAYQDFIDNLFFNFSKVRHMCWMSKKAFVTSLDFAEIHNPYRHYVIWQYENRELNTMDYVQQMSEKSIMCYIKEKIKSAKEELNNE